MSASSPQPVEPPPFAPAFVLGVTGHMDLRPDEVLRLIGKADRTIDTEATGTVWYYNRVAPDPASGKLSTAVITWNGVGFVKDVEFL